MCGIGTGEREQTSAGFKIYLNNLSVILCSVEHSSDSEWTPMGAGIHRRYCSGDCCITHLKINPHWARGFILNCTRLIRLFFTSVGWTPLDTGIRIFWVLEENALTGYGCTHVQGIGMNPVENGIHPSIWLEYHTIYRRVRWFFDGKFCTMIACESMRMDPCALEFISWLLEVSVAKLVVYSVQWGRTHLRFKSYRCLQTDDGHFLVK